MPIEVAKWQSIGPEPPSGGSGPWCSICQVSTYIELGGGASPKSYHPNLDAQKLPEVDLLVDFEKGKLPFHNGHAQRIKGIHFIEHISREAARKILRECYRILSPSGGSLFFLVSDAEFVIDRLKEDGICEEWLNCIYHAPYETPDGFHKWTYSFNTLKAELEAAGFVGVTHKGYYNRWEFYVEACKDDSRH